MNSNTTLEFEILYEDDTIVAINKPSGVLVHGDGRSTEFTVADWMSIHYADAKGNGEPIRLPNGEYINRPGIVHRLDRQTSGVLLLAKKPEAFEFLKNQFKKREIKKKYNAFVYGRLKDKQGTIDRPIGKSRSDFRKWSAQRDARGVLREAKTFYSVEKEGAEVSFIELRPQTGRTHQLRVHMKAINHEVLCDSLYAPKKKCLLGFNRLALHAREIQFMDTLGATVTVEAALPNDFIVAYNLI